MLTNSGFTLAAKVVSIVQKCAARERLVGIVRMGGVMNGSGGMTFIPLLPYLPHMSVKDSEVAHLPEDLQTEAGLEGVDTRWVNPCSDLMGCLRDQ